MNPEPFKIFSKTITTNNTQQQVEFTTRDLSTLLEDAVFHALERLEIARAPKQIVEISPLKAKKAKK